MSDIKAKKPKAINLRKAKKPRALIEPAKLDVKVEVSGVKLIDKIEPFRTKCFKCRAEFESTNKLDTDGMGHCPPCEEERLAKAREIDTRLGARPRETHVKEQLIATKSIVNGVEVTNYRDPITAGILGQR